MSLMISKILFYFIFVSGDFIIRLLKNIKKKLIVQLLHTGQI